MAAAACAACWLILAVVGSAIRLGIFTKYEGITLDIFQVLVFIPLIGNILSYLNDKWASFGAADCQPCCNILSLCFYFNQFVETGHRCEAGGSFSGLLIMREVSRRIPLLGGSGRDILFLYCSSYNLPFIIEFCDRCSMFCQVSYFCFSSASSCRRNHEN